MGLAGEEIGTGVDAGVGGADEIGGAGGENN